MNTLKDRGPAPADYRKGIGTEETGIKTKTVGEAISGGAGEAIRTSIDGGDGEVVNGGGSANIDGVDRVGNKSI